MKVVNMTKARARFSQLVNQAASGDDIIVSRNGKPLVRITRFARRGKRRIRFGVLKGKLKIAADFDAPLPAEVVAGFEGR